MRALLAIAAVIIALFASCDSTGCLDNQSSIPLAGFYDSKTSQSIAVRGLQIHGIGAPSDSLLPNESNTQVYLPMRSEHNTTAWCLHYTQDELDNDAFNDTVCFDYTSEPYFASEQCGAIFRYHIKKATYTTHLIDTIVIADSLISNLNREQIKIYFRTASADDATPEDNEEP